MRWWWRTRRRDEMRCREVVEVLQAHIDGELDPLTAQKVSTHLEACRRCGMEVATYRELKSRLARLSEPVDEVAVARLRAFVDGLASPGR